MSHHLYGLLAMIPFAALAASAAPTYSIDLSAPAPAVKRGHLDLGQATGSGSIAVNSFYLERDGKPFIPVIGEFHFSRYPAQDWERELRKIKAGGVTVVASYVFWNMHERQEGHFDWSGDLDLRHFVELCGKTGLDVIVRMGPFGHGEVRNGGLPDWLYGKPFEVRSNDPGYLNLADKLYGEIARQLKGLLYKDGGPVIGVQLENEFQHSAAPWEISYAGAPLQWAVADRDTEVTHGGVSVSEAKNRNAEYGQNHMIALKQLARKHGIDVPLYTATGWGNAAIVPLGSIPVTAAYAYPFWTPTPEPSPFYLFKDIQHVPDYSPVSFVAADYPSVPAELGAGIQPNYLRRPFVPDESVAPMIVRVLGSGSNAVGYYMYHGGANPVLGGFFNEAASGLPKINYDYQAPIGQYGRVKAHFHDLSLLHQFLASFGDRLAPLPSIRPAQNEGLQASDTKSLRYAARAAKGSGFLFLLNFQDHVTLEDIPDVQLHVADGRRTLTIPSEGSFTLKAGTSAILPINFDLSGTNLRSATVQPLRILRSRGRDHFVFFSIDGLPPELVFDSAEIQNLNGCTVARKEGATIVQGPAHRAFSFTAAGTPVLVLPREMARLAADGPDGHLLFADGVIAREGKNYGLTVSAGNEVVVHAYPALVSAPIATGATVEPTATVAAGMSAFTVKFAPITYTAALTRITAHKYTIKFDRPLPAASEVYMRVDYTGDTGMAFIDGALVDDHMYNGRPWEIGLRRFESQLAQHDLVLVFREIGRKASCLRDIPPEYQPKFENGNDSVLEVRGLQFTPEYHASLTFR